MSPALKSKCPGTPAHGSAEAIIKRLKEGRPPFNGYIWPDALQGSRDGLFTSTSSSSRVQADGQLAVDDGELTEALDTDVESDGDQEE